MENYNIKENFDAIEAKKNATATAFSRNPSDIKVIAVSKTHPASVLLQAYEHGITIFGENYVQELIEKQKAFEEKGFQPEWHYIGHLQTNKVKYIAPFAAMIHSVDSIKLAKEVSKQADKAGRTIPILLQVNTSGEDSKSGASPAEIVDLAREVLALPNVKLLGLMTIGTFSSDENTIRREFRMLKGCLNEINQALDTDLRELSMGMSHDFDIAIEEGSTFVRVGTAIFGEREYSND